ncbi:MAG: GNAT family N-acetyltransferase [Pleurocapsa sp. MO_192.B19]|nr:GNAT family N-acetyltransferase [Pleurocapsa sp. MO_192.B19]
MLIKKIELNSEEYQQACQLRYQLFYQPHGLSFDSVFDNKETESIHLAIIDCNLVVAYGQLTQKNDRVYQIFQMVVHPNYQRQGLGKKLLAKLIAIAQQKDASKIVLDARISAINFYQQLGFKKIVGTEHPSAKTGVPHIYMELVEV